MVTVNGKDYNGNDYDASTNPYGFGAGGHKEVVDDDPNYIQLATDIIADGTNSLQTTSTSSVTIGTGTKTFTMAAERPFLAGQRVRMIDQNDTTQWMTGIVTSWTSSTKVLVINSSQTNGSGSSTSWKSTLDGEVGIDGTFDINGLSEESLIETDDEAGYYDTSAAANKKISVDDLAVFIDVYNRMFL